MKSFSCGEVWVLTQVYDLMGKLFSNLPFIQFELQND